MCPDGLCCWSLCLAELTLETRCVSCHRGCEALTEVFKDLFPRSAVTSVALTTPFYMPWPWLWMSSVLVKNNDRRPSLGKQLLLQVHLSYGFWRKDRACISPVSKEGLNSRLRAGTTVLGPEFKRTSAPMECWWNADESQEQHAQERTETADSYRAQRDTGGESIFFF